MQTCSRLQESGVYGLNALHPAGSAYSQSFVLQHSNRGLQLLCMLQHCMGVQLGM